MDGRICVDAFRWRGLAVACAFIGGRAAGLEGAGTGLDGSVYPTFTVRQDPVY